MIHAFEGGGCVSELKWHNTRLKKTILFRKKKQLHLYLPPSWVFAISQCVFEEMKGSSVTYQERQATGIVDEDRREPSFRMTWTSGEDQGLDDGSSLIWSRNMILNTTRGSCNNDPFIADNVRIPWMKLVFDRFRVSKSRLWDIKRMLSFVNLLLEKFTFHGKEMSRLWYWITKYICVRGKSEVAVKES